tara:strand:- start:942 stop:1196 length:255 start_codon:yes stop_codon:yes gene_type:complete
MNLTGKCKADFEAWLDGKIGTYDLLQDFSNLMGYSIYVETMNLGGYRSIVEDTTGNTEYGLVVGSKDEAKTDVEESFNTIYNDA